MKDYFELLERLAPMDRCHCGPEMEEAYNLLTDYYQGSRKISYPCADKFYHWELPPYWECSKAVLKNNKDEIIADKNRNNLEVYSYSKSFTGPVSLEELNKHLLSDPNRPDAIIFHFRNQYRHKKPEWGFSIPHNIRERLKEDIYHVEIESTFDKSKNMIQADYAHSGDLRDEFMFMGHFDHPSMVNDGLAGCIAAFEIIKLLRNRKTKYSYRAFASIEIVGSVAYLEKEREITKNLKECLFLGFVGIDSPISYQQSFHKNARMDAAVRHLLMFMDLDDHTSKTFEHRQIVGNDENVFDSVGYEIPTGTLMRHPFPEYHTNYDDIRLTGRNKIDEIISFVLKTIDILEEDCYLKANYKGLPCLSNEEINLYLSPEKRYGLISTNQLNQVNLDEKLYMEELNYLKDNGQLLYPFMNNILRLSDGKHRLLEICNHSKIPFSFGLAYVRELEKKNILEIIND